MNSESVYLEADAAYENGEIEKAFRLFLRAAEEGDYDAMARVANMYSCGEGVTCNYEKAIEWEQRAIASGKTSSYINLAISYRTIGDMRMAKQWLEEAYRAGDGEAALELAKLYTVCESSKDTVLKYLNDTLHSPNVSEGSVEEARELLREYTE